MNDSVYITIELVNTFFGMVIISIYLKGLFQTYIKKPAVVALAYVAAGVVLGALSTSLHINPFIRLGCTFLLLLLLSKFLFGTKWLTSLYSALLFCAIAIIVENICSGIILLFGVPAGDIFHFNNMRILYLVLALLVELFCVYLVVRLSQWRKNQESMVSTVPLLLCQIASIFICYIMYQGTLSTGVTVKLSFVVGALGILYINIVIFVFVERIKEVGEIKKQNALAEQQYKSKLEYFEQVKDDQAETRALWHDIKKYLNTMNDLINRDDVIHARECIGQVSELFENIGQVVDVGNTVISAVLNHSVQKARRLSINTDLDVRVRPGLNISAADLSVIIGNTFDNAIEAVGALPEDRKRITVRLIEKGEMLFYEIINPYEPVDTVKKDRSRHGFGLKNVRRSVEKYKGAMRLDLEDGEFKVSVHMNIPPEAGAQLAS